MARRKQVEQTSIEPVIVESKGIDKSDNSPQVSIIGSSYDPEKGIKIELDWNDSFIKYLRNSGYSGTADELIVQKWLSDLCDDLSRKIVPNQNTSEYE